MQVFKRKDCDANGAGGTLNLPPGRHGQSDHEPRQRKLQPNPAAPLLLAIPTLQRGSRLAKHWHISAFGQFDNQRVSLAFAHVVFIQESPQPPCFRPHYGIRPGIVIRLPAEDLSTDHGLLQFVNAALQMPLHREAQEPGEALIALEYRATQNLIQMLPDRVRRQFNPWH